MFALNAAPGRPISSLSFDRNRRPKYRLGCS